jgi:hypothetical protein
MATSRPSSPDAAALASLLAVPPERDIPAARQQAIREHLISEFRESAAIATRSGRTPRETRSRTAPRHRARIAGLVAGSLLAVAAIAVAVPVALSGTSTPSTKGPPLRLPFQLSYTVTVNGKGPSKPPRPSVHPPQCGQSPANACPAPPFQPSFTVTPGEHLRINVDVTVPAHFTSAWIRLHPRWSARRVPVVTALWLGISKGTWGNGPKGPIGISPILAHARKPLGPGVHRFRLRWTVPAGLRPGTSRLLVAPWNVWQGNLGQPIAGLTVHSP